MGGHAECGGERDHRGREGGQSSTVTRVSNLLVCLSSVVSSRLASSISCVTVVLLKNASPEKQPSVVEPLN